MIDKLPDYPALQAIQNALWHVSDVRGAAVMVGSGFSLNAELASPTSKAPPLWSQMAATMEKKMISGSSGAHNPLRLAEEFRALLGQSALDGLIRDLVPDVEWLPSEAHRCLLSLPWSDVLSTNWDTLLERAKADLTEQTYDVVLTPEDISRTRSPRIVKLHGTLPSHTPFIFAEEDYRTYPVRFAPFVNLAQHVLLENELLLLGFSGDDPNFLAWAGWVRDQLGSSARKIRLAGVLDLSPARRRYLENLNVTPIDLFPLVEDISDPKMRHAQATKLLLDSLHDSKPRPSHVWTRNGRIDDEKWKGQTPAVRIGELVQQWKEDRESSPDWLMAPYYDRYSLRQDTAEAFQKALAETGEISCELRIRLAAELAWRLETSHFGVPRWAKEILQAALEEGGPTLTGEERLLIARLLCYSAIERREKSDVENLAGLIDGIIADAPEASAWASYLRCIWARDNLDIAAVSEMLPGVSGQDPVWSLRRASLLCFIRDNTGAAKLVRDALLEIRRRRVLDRRSLWLLSREAWAQFLWRSLEFELRHELHETFEAFNEWPTRYKEHRVDPWDELNSLDHDAKNDEDREQKYSREEKAHFEPGSWTPKSDRATHWVASWVSSPEWSIRRLADWIGIPFSVGSHDILTGRLSRIMLGKSSSRDDASIWRVCTYIKSSDGDLINRWFGRLNVAALPKPLVDEITEALRGSVQHLAGTLSDESKGYIQRIEQLRAMTEILSRLSVRSEPNVAAELVNLATTIIEFGGHKHWWLFAPINHLITRSLSAIPKAERGRFVEQMLSFPLPVESKIKGIERDWPEFADEFRSSDIAVARPAGEWDKRIAELIDWIGKDNGDNRFRAISRIWLLDLKDALSAEERKKFAHALWAHRTSPLGLPSDSSFYQGVFLDMPEPKSGMAAKAFDHDVVQPLLEGTEKPGAWESIAYVGSQANKHRSDRPFSVETALELIKRASAPTKLGPADGACEAVAFGLLPIAKLDHATAESLWQMALSDEATIALQFLPYLAKHDPSRQAEAVARLKRLMNSRDFAAAHNSLSAVRQWATSATAGGFPQSLATAVTSLVALRRDPGLFRALDVCVDLLSKGLLSKDDIESILVGMTELLVETDYREWRQGDFRTSTLTYVRANAFRLARHLKAAGHQSAAIGSWIEVGQSDPVPEVRFVRDKHD